MARAHLLLMDACVLIDFATIDESVLLLTSRHVGDLYVASPVLAEVRALDEARAVSLGIKTFVPTLDMVFDAANTRGRLSFEDRLCVIVAKAKRWTCVSNDRRLRASCAAENVPVWWGFDVLAALVEARAFSARSAAEIAKQIVESNKRITGKVLVEFYARIGVKE